MAITNDNDRGIMPLTVLSRAKGALRNRVPQHPKEVIMGYIGYDNTKDHTVTCRSVKEVLDLGEGYIFLGIVEKNGMRSYEEALDFTAEELMLPAPIWDSERPYMGLASLDPLLWTTDEDVSINYRPIDTLEQAACAVTLVSCLSKDELQPLVMDRILDYQKELDDYPFRGHDEADLRAISDYIRDSIGLSR